MAALRTGSFRHRWMGLRRRPVTEPASARQDFVLQTSDCVVRSLALSAVAIRRGPKTLVDRYPGAWNADAIRGQKADMAVCLDAEIRNHSEDLFAMRTSCAVCGTLPARPHRFTKAGTNGGSRHLSLCDSRKSAARLRASMAVDDEDRGNRPGFPRVVTQWSAA